MIDTIIEHARIFDGRSTTACSTDVAIVDDRIALIGSLGDRDAYERVSGTGLTLAPGFIDVHAHTDELWLADGRCEGKIRQGVTTEIGGNCGRSVAPALGAPDEQWHDLASFFALVERGGVALNVATLVGLGTTRRRIRQDVPGRLDPSELLAETALVRETIDQGAIGVSSGLIYTPSRFADVHELAACAAAARAAGMPRYVTHLRDEADGLIEAVEEALAVGRRADVSVQFSHHKAAWKRNWGKVHQTLARIDRARAAGLHVGADAYPYVAMWTDLETLLPDDARDGGKTAILARLEDEAAAETLAIRLELAHMGRWHDVLISSVGSERNAELAGRRLDEIASRWRLAPARAVLRLLRDERLEVEAIFFALSEADVATVLSADFVSIGSDASARALDGPTAQGVVHPRTLGCFPRVFGRFVRGRGTLEIGEAIRRMTSLAADQFGLRDRGHVTVGAYADLVLFDAGAIVDTATYDRPYAYPRGIESVWVNGRPVVRNGATTGARPGRVLRGGR